MNKLSKTQIDCIEEMKNDIDEARSCKTFKEWMVKTDRVLSSRLERNSNYFEENLEYYGRFEGYYEEYKKGNVLVGGYGIPTLKALERKGIVTVIEYDDNRNQGVIDWVHLNDY